MSMQDAAASPMRREAALTEEEQSLTDSSLALGPGQGVRADGSALFPSRRHVPEFLGTRVLGGERAWRVCLAEGNPRVGCNVLAALGLQMQLTSSD